MRRRTRTEDDIHSGSRAGLQAGYSIPFRPGARRTCSLHFWAYAKAEKDSKRGTMEEGTLARSWCVRDCRIAAMYLRG
jgi:hypothetical protein